MHYARKGIVTPEMEFVALRESMLLEKLSQNRSYASLCTNIRDNFGCPPSRTSYT